MRHSQNQEYSKLIWVILIGVSTLRLLALIVSPLNLHGDEAQYYSWSQNLDWGYFSKPPMIAWLIAATTSIFGHSEWAVRLSSVILHPLIAFVIFRTGQFVFNERTGFWAALVYILMPAVFLSSAIVSTDVPLLLCWALALNALYHMRETPKASWALLFGLSIGFGFLSKYAMVFFLIALVGALIVDKKTRTALMSKFGLLSAVIAFTTLLPNLYWNISHDFVTFSHTAANANLKGIPIHPGELLEFIISQFGVFGVITMILLMIGIFYILKHRAPKNALVLSLFILTPLLIICAEAFLSRANANWAVTAYVGGAIICAWAGIKVGLKYLKAGIGLNAVFGVLFIIAATFPSFADAIGQANALKRVRKWPQTSTQVSTIANAGYDNHAFAAIATDNRLVFYDLLYYGISQKTGLDMKMWLKFNHVNNQAEATDPLPASAPSDAPILLISKYHSFRKFFDEDFAKLIPLEPIQIDLGGGKTRILYPYAAYGYTPTNKADRSN